MPEGKLSVLKDNEILRVRLRIDALEFQLQQKRQGRIYNFTYALPLWKIQRAERMDIQLEYLIRHLQDECGQMPALLSF